MIEIPHVPSLRLGAARKCVNLLADGRSGRLECGLLAVRPTPTEFDFRMKWKGNACRLELELPPLSGICLLRFRHPNDFETLTGEQVAKRWAEQDLVKSFAEDMRCRSDRVKIEVFRV